MRPKRFAHHDRKTKSSGRSVVEHVVAPAVVDASVIVDLLVNGHPLPRAGVLVAPAHMDAEVLSALGRLHRQAVLTATDVEEMLDDLAALAVERLPLTALLQPAFALRTNVALRDALYVVLAQALGATLCTTDVPLACACTEQQLCAVSGAAPTR
jgi:predicted nucleic acid-binding protein